MLFASGFAERAGYQVNEAFAQPCLVAGADWGDLLVTLFSMGWLMLVTAPFMRASLVVWALVLIPPVASAPRRQLAVFQPAQQPHQWP